MKLNQLKRMQMLTLSIDQVFAFCERPENLTKLTPPSLGFQILTPSPQNLNRTEAITELNQAKL